jgi:ActR/RegA family two-component response regulator
LALERGASDLSSEVRVMNQRRVLIVDDDPALLQALPEALRLRMESVMVDTADSPEFQSKSTHYIRFPLSGACDR